MSMLTAAPFKPPTKFCHRLFAAPARFTEATRWNPTLADAYLKLGQAEEKFRDKKAAKDAYSKYLQLAPDSKIAPEIKKKLEKL